MFSELSVCGPWIHGFWAGEAELVITAVRLEECGKKNKKVVHLTHGREKQKETRTMTP